MFNMGSAGYPCFKSKAGIANKNMQVLLEVFREGMSVGDPYHEAVKTALETSCRLDEIPDEHHGEYVMPPAAYNELFSTCLQHVQQMAELKNRGGIRVFHQTFKSHWLLHAAYNARYYHTALG